MPYITQEQRNRILNPGGRPETAGELNWAITTLIVGYMETRGKNYQVFNDITGALANIHSELYRRVIAPYEDEKIKLNGDVF